jgi:glutathione synthase
MERINPPMIKAWMLRDGNIIEIDSLSELGLYSCLFLEKDQITFNESFGTLMRTKGSHSNEGGVNAGYAVID